jgi:hypothetical protein
MDMNLMELRSHLRTVGAAIAVKNTRLTTTELFTSCGASTPYPYDLFTSSIPLCLFPHCLTM